MPNAIYCCNHECTTFIAFSRFYLYLRNMYIQFELCEVLSQTYHFLDLFLYKTFLYNEWFFQWTNSICDIVKTDNSLFPLFFRNVGFITTKSQLQYNQFILPVNITFINCQPIEWSGIRSVRLGTCSSHVSRILNIDVVF